MKELCNSIIGNSNSKLMALKTREEVIKNYFLFDFIKKYDNLADRMEEFYDCIEILKSFALRWEREKFGFVCCVDRTYQYYLRPMYKKFWETL